MKVFYKILLGLCFLLCSSIHGRAQYDFSLTKLFFEIKTDAEVEALYENHFKAELKDSNLVQTYRFYSYDAQKGIEGYNEEVKVDLFEMRDQIQEYGFRYEQLFFSEITLEQDSVTSVLYKQRFANKTGYLEILFEPVFRSVGDWHSYSSFHVYCNLSELDSSELEYIQLDIDTSGMVAYKNRVISILETENKEAFDDAVLTESDIVNNTFLDENLQERLLRHQERLHEMKDKYWRSIKAFHSYSMIESITIRYFWQSHAKMNYRMIMLQHLQKTEYGDLKQLASCAALDSGPGFKITNFDD